MQENQVTLVLGPATSGKSEWAEKLAKQSKQSVSYIATAIADYNDPAWQQKLQKHASRRPPAWLTKEVPTALTEAIQKGTAQECLLIDSLGTWVANLLAETETDWEVRVSQFLESLEQTASQIILVGEETGWG